ncbi:MAG: hypothetical protein LBP20_02170 [Treponema sp.]|nr:hypothetical protein [Treponema sp.]
MKQTLPCPFKTGATARIAFICAFFCVSLGVLAAQGETPAPGGLPAGDDKPAQAAAEADPVVYVIRDIAFDITGRSRPFALRYHGKLYEGELLHGQEALDLYIKNHTQLLVNQRVLNEDVRITYTLGETGPDGRIPVDLLVSVSDTWNIMIFPKPIWDSNDGFDLTLKGRDYNFFGTMTPLRLDLGYQLNVRNESNFNFAIDTDIPFTALGLNWNIDFDNEFDYSWREALGYTNTAGVSVELPWQRTTFVFDITHRIRWYPKNDEPDIDAGYGKYFEGLINTVSFGVDWIIPTGLNVFGLGELSYTPRVSQNFTYRPGDWDSFEWENSRRSVSTGLDQTLSFGQIDWIGNFRRGREVSVTNTNSYNYIMRTLDNYYILDATGHFLFSDFFGIASRLRFRHWFNGYSQVLYHKAGDVLRGVLDNHLRANMMLSLNLEFPFRILAARPSEWFNSSAMRIFNCEIFLSPVMDFGLILLPGPINNQNALDLFCTGGMEALIFPDSMRSFYLRFSIAFNLENAVKTGELFSYGNHEFFIGLGHFF